MMAKSKKVKVDVIGLNSRARGGFRALADMFSTFLPQYDIDLCLFGYTRGNPKGSGKYIPILTRLFPNLYLIFLALFFVAPFLPIRKKAIIMTNRIPDQLPFIIFYPRHRKVCRITESMEALKYNNHKIIFHLYNLLQKVCLPFIDRFIVLNEATRDYLKRRYYVPDERISIIPVSVDLDTFQPMDKGEARKMMGFGQDTEVILYVGRLIKSKNIEMLLCSFKEIKKVRQDVLLILAGTGPHETKLKEFAHKHNIEGVRFLGYVDRNEIPLLMSCADVFALPSLSEAGPYVVLEALGCGLPVVSTEVGIVSQYVESGENGYVVEAEIPSFTNGLLKALENKYALREYAIQSREKMSQGKMSQGSVMELYAKVFQEVS